MLSKESRSFAPRAPTLEVTTLSAARILSSKSAVQRRTTAASNKGCLAANQSELSCPEANQHDPSKLFSYAGVVGARAGVHRGAAA